jgi:hypothetical protein
MSTLGSFSQASNTQPSVNYCRVNGTHRLNDHRGTRRDLSHRDGNTVFVVRLHDHEPCLIASPRCATLWSKIQAVRSSSVGETDVHTFYFLFFSLRSKRLSFPSGCRRTDQASARSSLRYERIPSAHWHVTCHTRMISRLT